MELQTQQVEEIGATPKEGNASCQVYSPDNQNRTRRPARIDEIGNKHGRLKVVAYERGSARGAVWECRCDCGAACYVLGKDLRNGHVRSCGCLARETGTKNLKENRIRPKLIIAFGETKSAQVWSAAHGVPVRLMCERLRRGWPAEDAVSIPSKGYRR